MDEEIKGDRKRVRSRQELSALGEEEFMNSEEGAVWIGVSVRLIIDACRSDDLECRRAGKGWLTTKRWLREWLDRRHQRDQHR